MPHKLNLLVLFLLVIASGAFAQTVTSSIPDQPSHHDSVIIQPTHFDSVMIQPAPIDSIPDQPSNNNPSPNQPILTETISGQHTLSSEKQDYPTQHHSSLNRQEPNRSVIIQPTHFDSVMIQLAPIGAALDQPSHNNPSPNQSAITDTISGQHTLSSEKQDYPTQPTFNDHLQDQQAHSDSLIYLNDSLAKKNQLLLGRLETITNELNRIREREKELVPINEALDRKNKDLAAELQSKNLYLEEQLRVFREKETLFTEKENLYRDAINSNMLDRVKLEGQLATRDSKLEGKEREISLLQQNIDEKSRDILSRNSEIQKIVTDKERSDRRIDSLRTNLSETEKSLVKSNEQLKYAELKLKDCEGRYSNVTNKKKKTRVVQGFAIKNFRTPDFVLAPKDVNNPSVYVISNNNTSNMEFDYVTGASFMIKDLSKPKANLTYDLGFFLGFGGNNLFKNFYIGPNIKLFDVIHLNMGANIAEYEVLKDGFKIGDALPTGTAIPISKEWKVNAYFGFTFDLELITMIGKR